MDREKLNDKRPSRLLLLHQGAIGDFILTLSVVQAVNEFLDGAHVTAVASSPSARLAAGRSVIRHSIHPDQVGGHTLFQADAPLNNRLLDLIQESDLVLSFLGSQYEPVHQRLLANTHGQVIPIDPRPTDQTVRQQRHITRQWCDVIRQTGLNIPAPPSPVIQLGDNHRKTGQDQETRLQYRIVIHPGSGGRSKCWPLENYLAVANSLQNVELLWMIGPAEVERDSQLVDTLRHRSDDTGEILIIEADLLRAAEIIASANLYIGNDSGMTHLAAALAVPTIGLFTTTDPAVWAPQGKHVHVLDDLSVRGTLTLQQLLQIVRKIAHGS